MSAEIIKDFPRSKEGELLRIGWSTYKGKRRLDQRIWYTDEAGELKPTRQGISILAEQLPELIDALVEASATVEAAP